MVSGYIGGDTLAAVLTRDRDFYRGRNLLVDIGTNGEVVLANDGRLTAISCATGPVYEGAHIHCGVRAAPGAIERVWIDDAGTVRTGIIADPHRRGEPRPVGLCGSGVISAVAALSAAGILGTDGRFVRRQPSAVAAAGRRPRTGNAARPGAAQRALAATSCSRRPTCAACSSARQRCAPG